MKVKDSFRNNECIDASTSSNDNVQIDSNRDLISKSNGENSSVQIDSDSESELEFENDIDSEVIVKQEIHDQSTPVANELNFPDRSIVEENQSSSNIDTETSELNASSGNRPPRNRNPPSKYQPETGLWTKTPNADQNLVIDEGVNTVMIPSSRHNEPEIVEIVYSYE